MRSDKLAAELEAIVLRRLEQDTLVLPTMPAVAQKCLGVLRDPEFSFQDAAGVLEQDPVLTARVLRTATGAALGAAPAKLSLVEALSRIGSKPLRTMLVEAAAKTIFVSRNPRIAQATKGLWAHSVAVAILARDLAPLVGQPDAEAAYLAGLLHDVGKPIVAALLLEAERRIAQLAGKAWIDPEDWVAVIDRTHRKVGTALAERWALPEPVWRCIRDCSAIDEGDGPCLANAVCLGNALAKQAGLGAGGVNAAQAGALVTGGCAALGLEPDAVQRLTADLKARVASLYG